MFTPFQRLGNTHTRSSTTNAAQPRALPGQDWQLALRTGGYEAAFPA